MTKILKTVIYCYMSMYLLLYFAYKYVIRCLNLELCLKNETAKYLRLILCKESVIAFLKALLFLLFDALYFEQDKPSNTVVYKLIYCCARLANPSARVSKGILHSS